MRVFVALALVSACAVGIWMGVPRCAERDDGLVALNLAYLSYRPVDARITGIGYAPVSRTRGASGDQALEPGLMKARLVILEEAQADTRSPRALHALGRLSLTERDFTGAIGQLTAAAELAGDNAEIQSDLGAAFLENGKALESREPGGGARDFAESLARLERAVQLNPQLLDPRYNLGLVYEEMKLYRRAAESWAQYLEMDGTSSGWSREARRNLNELETAQNSRQAAEDPYDRFVRAFESNDDDAAWSVLRVSRAGAGNLIIDRLLTELIDLGTKGDTPGVDRMRNRLDYAGKLEASRTGDLYTTGLAGTYSARGPGLPRLMNARKLMGLGRQSYEQARSEEAVKHFSSARNAFEGAGNDAEARYADYRLGHCYLRLSRPEQALRVFSILAGSAEKARYLWLRAQATYSIANAQISLNNYSEALTASNEFLSQSEKIGDPIGVINAVQQIGQGYLFLNDYARSLSFHGRSLSELSRSDTDPLQKWRGYFYPSFPLNKLGLHGAALDYQKEALRLARELGRPQLICRSEVNLGVMYGAAGEYDKGLEHVRRAFEIAGTLGSKRESSESLAYASLQAGHLSQKAGDLAGAGESYGRAYELYSELNSPVFKYSSLKGKLLACLATGGCSDVEANLEEGLRLFEEYRGKILEESNRDSFFDLEQDLYDAAIGFRYSTGNYDAAFNYAERSRARSLFEIASEGVATSADAELRFRQQYQRREWRDLRASLPDNVQILQYAVLPDKLIVFSITKQQSIRAFHYEISSKQLADLINGLLSAITKGEDDETKRLAKLIYAIVIGPAEATLDTSKLLCLVPDKILNHLPFAALVSGSGAHLVEDFALVHSPSTNMFVVSTQAGAARASTRAERALCVGDPSFDQSRFKPFEYLPDARGEAKAIAAAYDSTQYLYTGKEATKRRLLAEIAKADIVHFAGHAVADDQSPLRSRLLLASEAEPKADSDVLQAFEIYGLKLPRTRVVVLAACHTGAGRYYGGEGVISISRSFLAARIPLVVSSLWAVDSRATARLMISFHKERLKGLTTVEALRAAQRDMMSSDDWNRTNNWASFIVVGGAAQF